MIRKNRKVRVFYRIRRFDPAEWERDGCLPSKCLSVPETCLMFPNDCADKGTVRLAPQCSIRSVKLRGF